MATINVTKALIGKEDLSVGNSTFTRTTSTGDTATINKLNLVSFAEGWGTMPDEATPSISGRRLWVTGGTASDPITNFDDGVDGQEIVVRAAHPVTITHTASQLLLDGGASFNMAVGDTLTLVAVGAGASADWYETSRAVGVQTLTNGTGQTTTKQGLTLFDTTDGAIAATLPNGVTAGDEKTLALKTDGGTNAVLTVTSHATSADEVFTFADVADVLKLIWGGTEWNTLHNIGVTT